MPRRSISGCAHPLLRLGASFDGHVKSAKRFDVLGFLKDERVTITLTLLGALGILVLQFAGWKEIPREPPAGSLLRASPPPTSCRPGADAARRCLQPAACEGQGSNLTYHLLNPSGLHLAPPQATAG
jgi:hypothetical protein